MGDLATIALHKLKQCPDNIRRSSAGEEAESELKASIAAHGVIVSLIVCKEPKGIHKVIAGARRLNAMQQLVSEKKLPKSYPVPCYVLGPDEHPEECALIENTLRAAMHPIDEFESFERLHTIEKMTIDDIAARFGKSTLQIKQRLALGNASPKLRELCRKGNLSIDSLSAYTILPAHEDQELLYESLEGWGKNNSGQIRASIAKQSGYVSNHKHVAFIGLQSYIDAGGPYVADMFSDTVYLSDAELVNQLLKEKLQSAADSLKDAGWSWVDISLDHYNNPVSYAQRLDVADSPEVELIDNEIGTLQDKLEELTNLEYEDDWDPTDSEDQLHETAKHDLQDQIDQKEKELLNARNAIEFEPAQMAVSGCVVTLDYNGALIFEKGFVKRADKKKLEKSLSNSTDEDSGEGRSRLGTPPEPVSLPQSLLDDLSNTHLCAVKLDLAYSPEVAYTLGQFSIAWSTLTTAAWHNPLALTISDTTDPNRAQDLRTKQCIDELLAMRKSINTEWLHTDDVADSWVNFTMLSEAEQKKIVSWCVARSLKGGQVFSYLQKQINTNISKYWRPELENFFKRAPLPALLEYAAEIYNDPDYADNHPTVKKKDLAVWLAEECANMEPSKCWIPPMMREIDGGADE